MNSLVNRANKQVTHIKNDLDSLRMALEPNSTSTSSLATNTSILNSQLSASLTGLQGTIRDLELMTQNEFDPTKRTDYKEKVKLLQTDLINYRTKFDRLKHQFHEQERVRNREELFKTTATSRKGPTDETEDVTERLIAQREDEVLSHTTSRLDDFISIGMATISDLRSQKSALKSTQQSLFNATTSLGISQSIMRIIGQRSSQERSIFYFGVIATIFVIFILWKYF